MQLNQPSFSDRSEKCSRARATALSFTRNAMKHPLAKIIPTSRNDSVPNPNWATSTPPMAAPAAVPPQLELDITPARVPLDAPPVSAQRIERMVVTGTINNMNEPAISTENHTPSSEEKRLYLEGRQRAIVRPWRGASGEWQRFCRPAEVPQ